ncbi:MAG: hypothetical protein ACK5NG_02245 [Chthoniobacterales bacterium]
MPMSSDYSNDPLDESDDLLNLDEQQSPEELESQVQKARTELEDLRRKQEQIEREKLRLEELSRRQSEFEDGRADMAEKFDRGLSILQRETEELRRRLEQVTSIHENFLQQSRVLGDINPKLWTSGELPKELAKASAALEDARTEYSKAQAKIAVEIPESAEELEEEEYFESESRGFNYWLKAGFAFTLPLQVLALLAILVWLFSGSGNSPQ